MTVRTAAREESKAPKEKVVRIQQEKPPEPTTRGPNTERVITIQKEPEKENIIRVQKAPEPEKKPPPEFQRKQPAQREKKLPPEPDDKLPPRPEKKPPPEPEKKPLEQESGLKDKVVKKVRMGEETIVPPPPPPPPMKAPPPPPPLLPDAKPMTPEKAAKLETLKARPRRRPDWTDMMKEVEEGIKLKHVKCNDRSAPVIPKAKAKGQFVYESEKDNAHNQLLKQIQRGIRLKKVRTNDRSKPMLQGLRKFRRQMTIEEQIQKSASVADVVAVAAEPDELDDIDKVRDDLQSSKQMLALELRNKEALERENKRLMARLLNLEVELEKEKLTKQIEQEKGVTPAVRTLEDDKLITKLKEEANQTSKMAKDMESMYQKTAEELDVTRAKLESAWLQNSQLEMKLKALEKRGDNMILQKQPSKKLISSMSNANASVLGKQDVSSEEEESEEEETETETETDEDNQEETAAQQEKRMLRELKFLVAKLRTLKEKRATAIKEKTNLKDLFSKLSKTLKEENKKYKNLQKEVDKMAKLLKDVEEEEEECEEEEVDEDVEESESESESEETEEEEEESDGDMPESASNVDKINNLQKRIKVYETRLTSLKKSNYLLKANIDRRQDDLNRQKEMSLTLQEDLNSVLAELG